MMKLLNRLPHTAEDYQDLEVISFDPRIEHGTSDDELDKVLPDCFDIKEAYLSGIHDLSDRTLIHLGEYTDELRVLDVSGCQYIGPLGIRELAARATKLQVLRVESVWTMTDPVITNVVRTLGHLTELDLSDLPLITPHSVREIWTFSKQLYSLKLSRCKNLTDKAFPSPLPTESTFRLGGRRSLVVPPAPASAPAQPKQPDGASATSTSWVNNLPPLILPSHHILHHLQHVDISHCTRLTDDAIAGLIEHAPHITELNVAGCVNMTNRIMQSISRVADHLGNLDVSYCCHITDDGINKVVRNCPRLQSINVSCKHFTIAYAEKALFNLNQNV